MRSGDPRLLGALAWWGFDAAVLWAMLHALGAPPPFAVVVLGYFVGQVANTIPIPGAVSGGMVGVLLAFGVDPDLALAAVLAYRSVAIWLPAPIGLAALSGLRRTTARWSAEDAPERSTAAATPCRAPACAPPCRCARRASRRDAGRGVNLRAATRPGDGDGRRRALAARAWIACSPAASLAAAALAAFASGRRSQAPDLEGALTDLSETLGPWTYALVAALAFAETGRVHRPPRARARPRSCSAASSPRRAT